jgi:hypothetical protein
MKVILLLIILALFKKERFDLSDDVRTISADRWADILKPNRKYRTQSPSAPFASQTGAGYINQIDYWSNSPQIDLERAIQNSPITSDDINWEKLSDYEYVQIVGLLQGNYNRPLIKSINAS